MVAVTRPLTVRRVGWLGNFTRRTRYSWDRDRRVIGKAEWTRGEADPRFIVTSLKLAEVTGQQLYEAIYCARGETENGIQE